MRQLQRDVAVCQVRRSLQSGHVLLSSRMSFFTMRARGASSACTPRALPATFARATGAGLGDRLCFVHAVGNGGLAGMPSDLVGIVGDVDTPAPHCEMMFAAQQRVGDYHGNFTHAIFLKWLRNRFIPWVLHAHPHFAVGPPGAQLQLCLVLDNALYHTGSTEGGGGGLRFDPLAAPKRALLAGCAALHVTHTFAVQGGSASKVISVPMMDAGATLRGRAGVFPGGRCSWRRCSGWQSTARQCWRMTQRRCCGRASMAKPTVLWMRQISLSS